LLVLILLVCSAFFSACEAAFFSLGPLQLRALREKKGKTGPLVCSLLEKPRELLVTIYIGNELVNIAISALVTSIAYQMFGGVGVSIAIGIGTFLLLLFGEVLPKTISLQYAEVFSSIAAYPLKGFYLLVRPAQKLLVKTAEKLMSRMGLQPDTGAEAIITDEEFKTMVHLGHGEGSLESEESKMIHNVIEFGETTVSEIMTPKIEMFTLNVEEKFDAILPKIVENFYSRVPVYDKDEETVLGILFTKDLNHLKLQPRENFHLKGILHPVLFVPESKKIKELLQEFKKMKRHLAIVLDEYGSVCGLVTLEDILEELVGEIDSEMRHEESPVVKIGPNQYRLTATYSLQEFNEYFQSDLPEDQFDTIGGMVFGLFGRVPRFGEAVASGRFKFVVEKMKGPRILKLNLTVVEPAEVGVAGEKDSEQKERAF
jgi:CBS domain containing-hemolysin-like protein